MPTRDEIRSQVIFKLSVVTGAPKQKIEEKHRLEQDLGMTTTVRRAMAIPYSKISDQYPDGQRVTMAESANLKTVKASIDLVTDRANGKK